MAITKEQWKQITEQLSSPHGRVELKCGARTVIFSVQLVAKLKYGIVVFVDGEWRGEWMREDSDMGKLFLHRSERFVHSLKRREEYIKAFGGKRCPKARREEAERKYAFHTPHWPSTTALRRHYTKVHADAVLIHVGYRIATAIGLDESDAPTISTAESI